MSRLLVQLTGGLPLVLSDKYLEAEAKSKKCRKILNDIRVHRIVNFDSFTTLTFQLFTLNFILKVGVYKVQ